MLLAGAHVVELGCGAGLLASWVARMQGAAAAASIRFSDYEPEVHTLPLSACTPNALLVGAQVCSDQRRGTGVVTGAVQNTSHSVYLAPTVYLAPSVHLRGTHHCYLGAGSS